MMRLSTLESVRLPNYSVQLMCGLLAECGLDPKEALTATGIPASIGYDPTGSVSGWQELSLQQEFARRTQDRPDLWLTLGSRYRLLSHAHTNYGLMMSTAPSVEAAIRVGLTYSDLYYMLAEPDGIFDVSARLVGFRSLFAEMPEDLHRFATLRDVAVNCSVFNELWGEHFPFERVELPLPQSDEALVRPYLPHTELVMGAKFNCWRWSARTDLRKPPQSDPVLYEHYRNECDNLLTKTRKSHEVVDRLAELLTMTRGRLPLAEAASRLGVSARTLQRRLESRGLNYRELAALKRYQAACRLLVDSDRPVSKIAFEAGYDNISSFNFAF